MRILTLTIVAAFLFIYSAHDAYAIGDQFTVSQMVISADNDAPTIPTNVSAEPVDSDQITVTWDASTDNVAVAGYTVSRDGVPVATTTLLTYQDTGLLSETLYVYSVVAFDASGNRSGASATTSTTTLAVVTTPTTTPSTSSGSTSGTRFPLPSIVGDVVIVPGRYDALISWSTNVPTRAIVRWGVTTDFEIASAKYEVLERKHETHITGLLPGVEYAVNVSVTDRFGNTTAQTYRFTTEALPDTTAPSNVAQFRAFVEGNDAVLSWKNPIQPDFSLVRIIRKEGSYPVDPSDGIVVYEGDTERFRDRNVFARNPKIYYAAFSYDKAGNVSSGAIVAVSQETISIEEEKLEEVGSLRFSDIVFFEEGVRREVVGERVTLSGSVPFTVSVPYELMPENLKTIMVTLRDAKDQNFTFSFLLRIDKEKRAYEATIEGLRVAGEYEVMLSVLDYEAQTLVRTFGVIIVERTTQEVSPSAGFLKIDRYGLITLYLFLFLLLIIFLFGRRVSHHREVHA